MTPVIVEALIAFTVPSAFLQEVRSSVLNFREFLDGDGGFYAPASSR